MKPFHTLTKRGQVLRLKVMARKALDDFGIEDATLVPLEHMANTTFRVEAADVGRYVMRIEAPSSSTALPPRTEEQVRSEMEWLVALTRDTDLVIPVPVSTRDNGLLTRVEVEGVPEAQVCVLFRWIDGRFINKGLTPTHIERVGVFTARLHEHTTKQFVPPAGFTRPYPDRLSPEMASAMLKTVGEVRPREDVKVVDVVMEGARGAFGELATGPDVYGLIHAD